MSWFSDLYRSAVGKKAVMAITGIILFGFVFIHMIGNLKLYLGAESLNAYGIWLREVGYPALPHEGALWIARLVLLAAVVLHIWAAWQVTRMSREARPQGYSFRNKAHTSYASRTMRWGGVILLLFIIFHILHFTTGTFLPEFKGHEQVYHNVVTGFSSKYWYIVLFYVVAQVALGFHLYHGLWSLFQSLGWNHPRFNRWRNGFAQAFAGIITLGNLSFPLTVFLRDLVR